MDRDDEGKKPYQLYNKLDINLDIREAKHYGTGSNGFVKLLMKDNVITHSRTHSINHQLIFGRISTIGHLLVRLNSQTTFHSSMKLF